MWNEDELKGKGKQIKGAVKDKMGEALDNPSLEREGEAERLKGKIQEGVGKVRRQVKKAVDKDRPEFALGLPGRPKANSGQKGRPRRSSDLMQS